ncbi:MAG TPA: lipoate--protein ligase family protein [Bacteroidetes bacterium]|nr:lipoate--protein ligase family protein [Bacteroidota bacterium]
MKKLLETRLLIDLQGRSGAFNMAADSKLAEQLPQSDYGAAVRFYRWERPSVSIGCHQLQDAVDLKACRKLGWDVVYRPTGGRALLHDNDLSYAVVIPSESDSYALFRRLYERIGEAIAEALRMINFDAAVIKPTISYVRSERRMRAGLCLDSRVRGEVTVSGKKVAAAAQHIFRDTLLQHGSIMMEGDPAAIARVSNLTDSERMVLTDRLHARAGTLNEMNGGTVDVEALVELLQTNFARYLGLHINPDVWTDNEIDDIIGRSPDFEICNTQPA